jgi:hypothetical protein
MVRTIDTSCRFVLPFGSFELAYDSARNGLRTNLVSEFSHRLPSRGAARIACPPRGAMTDGTEESARGVRRRQDEQSPRVDRGSDRCVSRRQGSGFLPPQAMSEHGSRIVSLSRPERFSFGEWCHGPSWENAQEDVRAVCLPPPAVGSVGRTHSRNGGFATRARKAAHRSRIGAAAGTNLRSVRR